MKNARNQHRTDYAKELIKIVQTTKDREELKKKIAAYHERDIANAIVESDKTVRKCIYDILDIADIAEIFSYIEEEPGKYLEEMPIEQAAKVVSNMDSDDAMDLFEELNEEDNKRANYYKYYTKQNWGDPKNYDMIINTSKVSLDKAADIIISYVKSNKK